MNGSSCEGISNKCFVSDEEIRLQNHLACTLIFLTNDIVYIEIISTSNQGNFFCQLVTLPVREKVVLQQSRVSFPKTALPLPSGHQISSACALRLRGFPTK